MSRPAITPSALLLLGIGTAQRCGDAGIKRDAWLIRALVEELRVSLPSHGPAAAAASRYWDPQRGVSERAVARATEELLQSGFLHPVGTGREAKWIVSPLHADTLDELWSVLSKAEQKAVRTSAQRALAISVAWSKTRCA